MMDKLTTYAKRSLVKAAGLDIGKGPIMEKTGGRVLYNHAVMYIIKGTGYFEDVDTRRQRVEPGTVFYQYPNKWHRFDPDSGTVWTEYWILFDGQLAQRAFGKLIPEKKHIHEIGLDESIIEAYEQIYDLWIYGSRAYNEYASLLLHKILAQIYFKISKVSFRRKDDVIHRAKMLMKNNLQCEDFDFRAFADDEGIGYEVLRKRFKKETDQSPGQYFSMLKMGRAKELLLRPRLNIKEIAYTLGFDDPYYFSRFFKMNEGVSPKLYRQTNLVYRGRQ